MHAIWLTFSKSDREYLKNITKYSERIREDTLLEAYGKVCDVPGYEIQLKVWEAVKKAEKEAEKLLVEG